MDGDNTQFGRYLLRRRLAFGGMAEIFLASLEKDEGFAKEMVLKRILPHYGSDPDFVAMFRDEAVIAARLNHPNIVQIYDFGQVDGVYYIAMEYVDGIDLKGLQRRALEKGRLITAAETAAIGEDIARALAYAHALRDGQGEGQGEPLEIVHRDVSPHNIMVSRNGESKLMDFGIARAAARFSRTATGTVKGKVAYMAPEQAGGRKLDGRVDVFALGVVLWEVLSGERLFRGDSDLEILNKVLNAEVRPLQQFRPDLPQELILIINRALEKDPDNRFATASEFEKALSKFRYSLGPDGAVDLAQMVSELNIEVKTPPAPRGTLVLEPEEDETTPEESIATEPDELQTGPLDKTDPVVPEESVDAKNEAQADPRRTRTMGDLAPSSQDKTLLDIGEQAPGMGAPVSHSHSQRWGMTAYMALLAGVLGVLTASLLFFGNTHQEESVAALLQTPEAEAQMLRLRSLPSGAAISIDGVATGLKTPTQMDAAQLKFPTRIQVRVAGYIGQEKELLAFPSDGLVLFELVQSAPSGTHEIEKKVPESRPNKKIRRVQSKKDGSKTTLSQEAPASKGSGFLSLRSRDVWLEVFLGGRSLGVTPLARIPVPVGKIRLTLKNPAAGINKEIWVRITKDAELKKTVKTQ